MPSHQNVETAFVEHDHKSCYEIVLAKADKIVHAAGLRLTPVRRRTLEILLQEHRAMGAYQVLDKLADDGFGKQPPVAYRALEFLVENGLAHRVRRLNAFAACVQPDVDHAPIFFICSGCDLVAEATATAVKGAITNAGDEIGFTIDRTSVEAVGTCPNCATRSDKCP